MVKNCFNTGKPLAQCLCDVCAPPSPEELKKMEQRRLRHADRSNNKARSSRMLLRMKLLDSGLPRHEVYRYLNEG